MKWFDGYRIRLPFGRHRLVKSNRELRAKLVLLGFVATGVLGRGGSVNADFTFGTPTKVPNVKISSSEIADPEISSDGLSLYFGSRQSGGYGSADIWVSIRAMTDDNWGTPVNIGPPVNSSDYESQPTISADSLELYFADGRHGSTKSSHRPGGYGGADIWVSRRPTTNDSWAEPVNLGPTVNSSAEDSDPEISADGLTLLFHSDRPDGYGDTDLWVTTRPTKDSPWTEPVNLGPNINTRRYDGDPDISYDGLMLFFCNYGRADTHGDSDIYVTRRATTSDPWEEPVNLGPIVNSTADDSDPSISVDGSILYFGSNRSGVWEIWQMSIEAVVDLNGDGIVDAGDMCIMVDHWGEDYSLCDIGTTPFGNGIVDFRDLAVLTEYWLADSRIIGHWKMDETEGTIAYDSAGDNDGTLHDEPFWQSAGGRVDGALQFDGINDYVSTDFVLNPLEGPFSAFAWIKGGQPGQVIISQADGMHQGSAWLCAEPSDGKLTTKLMHPPFPPLESESIITDGQWHHIGLVYKPDVLKRYLYVDGVEVAKDTTIVIGVPSDGGLYFGAGKDLDASSFWSGLMDDVRIYNVSLSAEEIEELAR